LNYHWLGTVPYPHAWDLQAVLAAEIAAGERPSTLLLLEHPPTYTFGRRGNPENLLWDEAELAQRGIQVYWVDRGGDVTYHGPGQLVGYPILSLTDNNPVGGDPEWTDPPSQRQKPLAVLDLMEEGRRIPAADYIGYLRKLEKVLIQSLARFGIVSGQIPGMTGVWVQPDPASRCRDCPPDYRQPPAKIAAIGVKVDARGISRHGFALNVRPQMDHWKGIVGCGLDGFPVTSMAELKGDTPPMDEVVQTVAESFGAVFGQRMERATLAGSFIQEMG
jgi:lipoyl(octanoyl) transferase